MWNLKTGKEEGGKKTQAHPLLDTKVRNETYNPNKAQHNLLVGISAHQPLLMFASLDPVVAFNKSCFYICLTLSVFCYDLLGMRMIPCLQLKRKANFSQAPQEGELQCPPSSISHLPGSINKACFVRSMNENSFLLCILLKLESYSLLPLMTFTGFQQPHVQIWLISHLPSSPSVMLTSQDIQPVWSFLSWRTFYCYGTNKGSL